MFCCACSGTCNHVGPHSYCAAHGGMSTFPPAVPKQNTGGFTVTTYACPRGGDHDFAVGDTRAICNRCEKIVVLSSDEAKR